MTGTFDERPAAFIDGVLVLAAATVPVQRITLSLVINPATHPLFAVAEARKPEWPNRRWSWRPELP